MKIKLFADPACWEFAERFPNMFASFGCGPGGWGDWLVPDTLWFLSVKPACQIHDWYYRFHEGCSEDDRAAADRIFFNNMLRIINAKGGCFKKLRIKRAVLYFNMVRLLGGPAYWEDRNKPEEYREV